jgi:hypothetical protein
MCTPPRLADEFRTSQDPYDVPHLPYLYLSPESSRWRVGPHAEASHRLIVFGLRIARHFFGEADLEDLTITHISIY